MGLGDVFGVPEEVYGVVEFCLCVTRAACEMW